MAFGTAQTVTDIKDTEKRGGPKYIGLAPVRIIAVNPTAEEAVKLGWQGSIGERISTYRGKDGNEVKQANVMFLLKMDESIDENFVFPISFNIRNRTLTSQSGKTKVIDQYGNTSWVTKEQGNKQEIPVSSSGKPLSITTPYRPMYDGEDKLLEFIKRYLCIPEPFRYDGNTKTFKLVGEAELANCKAQLDRIKNYFNGDFSEIKGIVKGNEAQLVKVLFYVGTFNGYEYQKVYWKVMRANSNYFNEIDKAIEDDKKNNRLNDCTILAIPVQPYEADKMKPVSNAQQVAQAAPVPFGAPSQSAPQQMSMSLDNDPDALPF